MKNFFQKWWKKALISLVIAVVLAVALEFLQVKTQPPYYVEKEISTEQSALLNNSEVDLSQCFLENGIIIPEEEEDAVISFAVPGGFPVNRFRVVLDKPAESAGEIRAFYKTSGAEEEGESEVFYFDQGKEELTVWIPKGNYEQIRLQAWGKIAIREINAENILTEKVFEPGGILKKRIAILTVLIFIVSMILWAIHGWQRLQGCFRAAKQGILEDPRKTAINALIFLGTGGIAWLILRLYLPYLLGKPFNFVLNTFSIFVALAVGCLFCFRKTLGRKPEAFFLVLCLLIGINFAFFYPAGLVSWDEEYHASNAIRYSYLGNARYSAQDDLSLMTGRSYEKNLSYFDETIKEQNDLYNQGITSWRSGFPESKNFWTIFSGLGFFIGRVLKLPYHWIWSLGRFFGLLAYAVIGYFAIRRLKSGKMILAAVLLIPTCIFLASTFSYDAGVISFTALGMSYLVREWQEPEKKIEWKNAFIMIGAFFLGCLAKAIYFPVLLLPLFTRKSKFTDSKQRWLYMGLSVGALLILVASFAVPFLSSSGGGDLRGGEDVNSTGQAQYILSHPLEYTGILLNFLKEYLNPDGIKQFLTFFAYMGFAPNSIMYLMVMVALAFTDRDGRDLDVPGKTGSRFLMLAILFGTVALVATSMYVSFTPVGSSSINGCQPRYLLPLFFPAMMLVCPGKIRNDLNKTLYNGIFFALIGFVGFSAALTNCMGLYV